MFEDSSFRSSDSALLPTEPKVKETKGNTIVHKYLVHLTDENRGPIFKALQQAQNLKAAFFRSEYLAGQARLTALRAVYPEIDKLAEEEATLRDAKSAAWKSLKEAKKTGDEQEIESCEADYAKAREAWVTVLRALSRAKNPISLTRIEYDELLVQVEKHQSVVNPSKSDIQKNEAHKKRILALEGASEEEVSRLEGLFQTEEARNLGKDAKSKSKAWKAAKASAQKARRSFERYIGMMASVPTLDEYALYDDLARIDKNLKDEVKGFPLGPVVDTRSCITDDLDRSKAKKPLTTPNIKPLTSGLMTQLGHLGHKDRDTVAEYLTVAYPKWGLGRNCFRPLSPVDPDLWVTDENGGYESPDKETTPGICGVCKVSLLELRKDLEKRREAKGKKAPSNQKSNKTIGWVNGHLYCKGDQGQPVLQRVRCNNCRTPLVPFGLTTQKIGSNGKVEYDTIEVPLVMHRALPPQAKILSVTLRAQKEGAYTNVYCYFSLLIPPKVLKTKNKTLTLDLKPRLLTGQRLLVTSGVDSTGKSLGASLLAKVKGTELEKYVTEEGIVFPPEMWTMMDLCEGEAADQPGLAGWSSVYFDLAKDIFRQAYSFPEVRHLVEDYFKRSWDSRKLWREENDIKMKAFEDIRPDVTPDSVTHLDRWRSEVRLRRVVDDLLDKVWGPEKTQRIWLDWLSARKSTSSEHKYHKLFPVNRSVLIKGKVKVKVGGKERLKVEPLTSEDRAAALEPLQSMIAKMGIQDPQEQILAMLLIWRKKSWHMYEMLANIRRRVLARRRDIYAKFGAILTDMYDTVFIGEINLGARLRKSETPEAEHRSKVSRRAALSEFKGILRNHKILKETDSASAP